MADQAAGGPASRGAVILRNILHIGMGQAVSTGLGFILMAALARSLGAADFGLYIIVLTIGGFVYVFVDWGQSNYLVSHVARGGEGLPRFLGTALAVKTAGTLVAAAVAAAIALMFWSQPGLVLLATLYVILGLPGGIAQTLGFVFRGKDQMGTEALVANLGKAFGLLATLIVLLAGGRVFEVIVSTGVGAVGWLVAAVVFIRQARVPIAAPTVEQFKSQVRMGAPMAWSSLVFALHPLINVWVLSRLTAPEVVGWYGAANSVFGLFVIPAGLLVSASFPLMARAADKPQDLSQILATNGRLLLLLSAYTTTVFIFFADMLVALVYGYGRFANTADLLRGLLLFLPLLTLGNLLGTAMSVLGRLREVAIAKIVFIAVTSLLAWLLIGYFQTRFGNGALVIVYVAGIAELGMLACFVYLLPKDVQVRALGWDLLRTLLVAALALLILWLLKPLSVWLIPPASIVAFFGLAWVFGLVGYREIDQFQRLVLKRGKPEEGAQS